MLHPSLQGHNDLKQATNHFDSQMHFLNLHQNHQNRHLLFNYSKWMSCDHHQQDAPNQSMKSELVRLLYETQMSSRIDENNRRLRQQHVQMDFKTYCSLAANSNDVHSNLNSTIAHCIQCESLNDDKSKDGSRAGAVELKPNFSYIGLIAKSILSKADKRMILSEIYQWIQLNYPYFRSRGPGWRNSVRHNLSLNDCFIKVARAANGKGHFWSIHPANLKDFINGDFRRRRAQRKVRQALGLLSPNDHRDTPSPESPNTSPSTITPLPVEFDTLSFGSVQQSLINATSKLLQPTSSPMKFDAATMDHLATLQTIKNNEHYVMVNELYKNVLNYFTPDLKLDRMCQQTNTHAHPTLCTPTKLGQNQSVKSVINQSFHIRNLIDVETNRCSTLEEDDDDDGFNNHHEDNDSTLFNSDNPLDFTLNR